MIAIIDYGLGNIRAFANIYKRLNIMAEVTSTTQELQKADKIILPGVGAFDWAMKRLNESGLRETLEKLVIGKGKPILGVCVGMQMMANKSEEGKSSGLGWIEGVVKKLDCSSFIQKTHLPHMGWNSVSPNTDKNLFINFTHKAQFYFLHSYYFVPSNEDNVLAVTNYNGHFSSAISADNVFGVQFHPEKSHKWGIQLLRNFAEL